MIGHRIKTLVVDDSALVRRTVTDALARFPEIEVVGTAVDPYAARDKILDLKPDVLTLDIEMPRMDGLTFLRVLMKHHPLPVIVMSSITREGSAKALEALQAGAVDVIPKPGGPYSADEDGSRLAQSIMAAAQAVVRRQCDADDPPAAPAPAPAPARPQSAGARRYPSDTVTLIGASTGGTEAIKKVLLPLGADAPPICIVQHIPAYFSAAFANRLNEICKINVREARHGDAVQPGLALVAPGGQHMLLKRGASGFQIELSQAPKVHHQRPAVDLLFDSAARAGAGGNALAILLTGMGSDGAEGMARLRQAGVATVAQDEASCVVFGMPREAIKRGAAKEVLGLDRIGPRIEQFASGLAL